VREDEPWEPPVIERAALVLWARTSGDGAVRADATLARRLAARDRVNRLVGPAIVLCVVIGSIVADGLGRQTLMIVEGIAGGMFTFLAITAPPGSGLGPPER